jgi:hypothetical protein
MLLPETVAEIHEMLAEGKLSQRQIAKVAGVSRATVNAIARGRRLELPPRDTTDDDLFPCLPPPIRCRGCGARVHPPCRVCRIRAILARRRLKKQ